MFYASLQPPVKTGKPGRWLNVIDRAELEDMLGAPVEIQQLVWFDVEGQSHYSEEVAESARALFCVSGIAKVTLFKGKMCEDLTLDCHDPDSPFRNLIVVPPGTGFEIKARASPCFPRVILWATGPTVAHVLGSEGRAAPIPVKFSPREIERRLGAPVAVEYMNSMDPGAAAGHHYHKAKREVFACLDGTADVGLLNVEIIEPDYARLGEGTLEIRELDYARLGEGTPDLGQTITVPPRHAHAVWNVGDKTARFWVWATAEPRIEADDFDCQVPQRNAPAQTS